MTRTCTFLPAAVLTLLLGTAFTLPAYATSSGGGSGGGSSGSSGSSGGSSMSTGGSSSVSGNTGSSTGTSTSTGRSASTSGSVGTSASRSSTSTNTGASSPTWSQESRYWSENYSSRPYYESSNNYSTYEPAYRYGYEAYNSNGGRSFDTIDDAQLRSGWEQSRGNSTMDWNQARDAARDAYNRRASSATPSQRTSSNR